MNINFQYKEFNQDNLSIWIFQQLSAFFASGATTYDIEFDFSGKTFSNEISFLELFSTESKGYEWACLYSNYFSKITDVLHGIKVENEKTDKKPIYRLSFNFDKATFDSYPNFDSLRCHKLSFLNTIFKKGARFRHIDANDVLFQPRELSADATFYHRERADIKNGILRGNYIGRIGTFKFRHPLEGNGRTFFVGVVFDKKAEFTDAILDNVVFSYIEKESMSKCFFANSFLENAEFYNCEFPLRPNIASVLDREGWYKNNIKVILQILVLSFVLLFTIYKTLDYTFVFLAMPLAVVAYLILFGFIANIVFMPSMFFIQKILNNVPWFYDIKINCHIATADDDIITFSKNSNAILNSKSVREIYRQLKINFQKHGDYQKAGDFYYSQRYCEIISFGEHYDNQLIQFSLVSMQHWVNGFGERWLRAVFWFWLVLFGFTIFAYTPNKDFISTKSTPEYFLHAYTDADGSDENHTCKIYFDRCGITNDLNKSADFMLVAKTSFDDENVKYKNIGNDFVNEQNQTKRIFAYDNRFDYQYSEQYIPMLKDNDLGVRIAHSLSKMIAPFISEEKKWFQDRSKKAYYLGFLEAILLWFFFGAFVFALKNRIRR